MGFRISVAAVCVVLIIFRIIFVVIPTILYIINLLSLGVVLRAFSRVCSMGSARKRRDAYQAKYFTSTSQCDGFKNSMLKHL